MAATRRRVHVIRERNERGFSHFLQNLKTVLRVFLNPDLQITDESCEEVLCQLFDANGTLSLLKLDIERGDPNPTGFPASAIQEPIQNLSSCICHLIYLISSTKGNEDTSCDAAYSSGVVSSQGPGRRRYEITKDQLEHLRSLFFPWKKIADMLQVSISTIQRRRKEFGLSDEFEGYSNITDDELDMIYESITGNSSEGPVTPNIGR